MKTIALILACVSTCLLAACLVSPENAHDSSASRRAVSDLLEEFPAGETRYDYMAWDGNGDRVVTGVLVLMFPGDRQDGMISGTWDLDGPQDPSLGPQIGQGILGGTLHDGVIAIDLNPENADFNVYLYGHFSDESGRAFRGAWSYSTIVGVVNQGMFSARHSR